jgi:hypothetical protein
VGAVVFCSTPQTAQNWNNMPAGQTELFGNQHGRRAVDLSDLVEFRLSANQSTGGSGTASLRAQYSTDGGTTWNDLEADGLTTGDLDVGAGTGLKVGTWAGLDPAAADDVQLRMVGYDGNGTADPAFRYIGIEFR